VAVAIGPSVEVPARAGPDIIESACRGLEDALAQVERRAAREVQSRSR
jgi:hypothetical protein